MGKGPLVSVQLKPGRLVKMHRQDAIEAGLLQPKKKQKGAEDKMRRPAEDKGVSEGPAKQETAAEGDDLTEIPGVGPSTAEKLRAQGLETLEALYRADLSALDGRTRRVIEKWRGIGEGE